MMGTIYLIRHGRTEWNEKEVFRGQFDIPLDDFGRRQARALAETLQKRNLKDPLFFSSPLKRALETGQIASSFLGKNSVQIEKGFTDLNFGIWQGMTKTQVEKEYPELYKIWLVDPARAAFPGGESLKEVAKRAKQALVSIARKYKERDVLIITHRVVNKVLLCSILEAGLNSFWKIRQDTACLNILAWEKDSFSVVLMNDTCHLRPLEVSDAGDF